MRAIALMVVGISIASAVVAQEGEVQSQPPIDLSLEAPALLTVGRVPDSDHFLYLQFRTVPDADMYRVWREVEGVGFVSYATFDPPPSGEDADELLSVIVFAPEGPDEGAWVVSALIENVETQLAWGRLPTTPTAVRSTSWGAVKADR